MHFQQGLPVPRLQSNHCTHLQLISSVLYINMGLATIFLKYHFFGYEGITHNAKIPKHSQLASSSCNCSLLLYLQQAAA